MTWKAHIKNDNTSWLRNILSIFLVNEFPDGTVQYISHMDDQGKVTVHQLSPGVAADPNAPSPYSFNFDEAAWRAINDTLNNHFGNYGPQDYTRLREDHKRVQEELSKANAFIRETLDNIISTRKSRVTDNNK